MATVVLDTFTSGSNGVEIINRTGETGATWAYHPTNASLFAMVQPAGQVRKGGGSNVALAYASGVPATAEYDVIGGFVPMSATGEIGIVACLDATAATYLHARYLYSSTRWELYKFVSGSATLLGNFSQSLTLSQRYEVTLQVRTGGANVLVDGVQRITTTDTAVTGIGKCGLRSSAAGGDTTGVHLTDFTVNDGAGGGGGGSDVLIPGIHGIDSGFGPVTAARLNGVLQ